MREAPAESTAGRHAGLPGPPPVGARRLGRRHRVCRRSSATPLQGRNRTAYFIRGHLEALATTVAGPYLTAADFSHLQALVAQMDAADQANDGVRYGTLHQQFHLAIYERDPYPKLVQMIRDFWSHETLFQLVFTTQPTRRQSS